MKKEENCLRLEESGTALAKTDAERLSAGVSALERVDGFVLRDNHVIICP